MAADAGTASCLFSVAIGPARLHSAFALSYHMYPNLKKGVVVGLIVGLVAGALVFGLFFWASTWPAFDEVSVTWAFRPWWRASNWLATVAAFVFFALVSGVLAAFRPKLRGKQ